MNSDFSVLSRWFGMNYSQLNADKTHAVASGTSLYEYEFILMMRRLRQDTLKLLGVVLDSKLTSRRLKKAYTKALSFRRLSKIISKDLMLHLYKAYVLPRINY